MANSEAEICSDVASTSGGEYQVFLSFRGPDTRHGFTDFLYDRLVDAGVRVFRDDDELRVGKVISENLLRAINNSIIYITIFSRTYASSKWCLWELAHIVDNVSKSKDERSILPIFLDVEPNDVKLKPPIYRNDLSKHEREFPTEVEVWRAALAKVGKIKGWNVISGQAAVVKSVVKEVLEKLKVKQKLVTEHLVGLDDRIKDLTKLLDVNHDDVRLIGIYGMGGIGKTTIAKVVFNQLCFHFEKCCSFLEGVREQLTKEGIVPLQKKLLSDIDGFESVVKFDNKEEGMRRIGEILRNKKVLLVLDDVGEKDHIEQLIGNSKLDSGSRIIITTRDTTVLKVEGFKGETLQYEMLKMDVDLALQLFGRHAFSGDFPSDDYRQLSIDIVSTTGGLPLAIEVIGSLLNGKGQEIWEETLEKLRKVPEKKILEKLRISYDDLEQHHKQIFLDIACFFLNKNKNSAIYMWTCCQFYPKGGIKVLTDKCLLKILDNDKFWMHDQLIALGKQIVREDCLGDLGKQSRLWIVEEALEVIKTQERKQEVQALELSRDDPPIVITNDDFERLPNLRFLKLLYGTFVGDFARCGSNLRWLHWHSPPEKNFGADNMYFDRLVVCKLEHIAFKNGSKAWDLIKNARNLKVLSITQCSSIEKIPKISECSDLERLTIADCCNLRRIESFIGNLRSLIKLKIKRCGYLKDLPEEVGALVKLKHFSLTGCTKLRELPSSLGNLTSLTELDLTGTSIRELPNSIAKLKSLRVLRFPKYGHYRPKDHVWQLPSGISSLVNLEELDLYGHYEMRGEIPIGIGELSSLRILNLKRTSICGIPRTIKMLHHLQTLELGDCHEIQELPKLPTSLTCLHLESELLLSVPNLSNLTNLVELLLSNDNPFGKKSKPLTRCNLRWIGRLSRLKKLELNLLNVPIHPDLASLSCLEELFLNHVDLETLVQLPSSLLRLDLRFFSIRRAEVLPSCLRLRNLSSLYLSDGEVEDIPLEGLPQLEKLIIRRCKLLQRLSIPSELMKLRRAIVLSCPELVEIQVVHLKSFESLWIKECKSLTRLSGLKNLENLCCNEHTVVEGLHEIESLDIIEGTPLTRSGIILHRPRVEILLDASDKKVAFFVGSLDDEDWNRAMRMVAGFAGVYSAGRADQTMTVTGDMDAVELVNKLSKMFHDAEIICVGWGKRGLVEAR